MLQEAAIEFGRDLIAAAGTALAVKLIDDYLDEGFGGGTNLARRLGQGWPVYAVMAFVLAAAANVGLAVALMLASYAVGMLNSLDDRYPLGLTGLGETVIAVVLGLVAVGANAMLGALFAMEGIQMLDDLLDWPADRDRGGPSYVRTLGGAETAMGCAAGLLGSLLIDPVRAAVVWGVGGALILATRRQTVRASIGDSRGISGPDGGEAR